MFELVRPTERRKGYGTQSLTLALGLAREVGLKRVLITCDADNRASGRVIEANGGRCEREFIHDGTLICHYQINL